MSQLYLYSNIWIYIWSVFSRVGTYFTYLIHNEASPVCGNYLPCETQSGDRGALREGLSRPLGLLTKTWLIVCCTPPFISIISEIALVGSPFLCGQTLHWAPAHSVALIGPSVRHNFWLGDWHLLHWNCVVLAVSKFWKVVCWSRCRLYTL